MNREGHPVERVKRPMAAGQSPDGLTFTPLRKKQLAAFYQLFLTFRPEPLFIDIYEPLPFPSLQRFVEFFSSNAHLWVAGPLAAPQAYFALHDMQPEHDLANLDFLFFDGYPAPGSAVAQSFWAFVQQCLTKHGLTRVQSFALTASADKLQLIESYGFRSEGVLREHFFYNGVLNDIAVHAWMTEERGE